MFRVLAECGVISRRHHPELATAVAWLARTKRLAAVLPGVYAHPQAVDDFGIKVAALHVYDPDAVVVGRAAARLTFWPQLRAPVIGAAGRRAHAEQPGFRFVRRVIPPELVIRRAGIPVSAPQLTALDLCEEVGGDGIDQVLRTGSATLDELHEALALTGGRPGQSLRRQLLLDSRSEPWSAGERKLHRLLREAGITGWKANVAVMARGSRYYLDVAFEELRLALEFDGLQFHGPETFERDHWRQNALILDGWLVLRFTWDMVINHPEAVVEQIRCALEYLEIRHSMARGA